MVTETKKFNQHSPIVNTTLLHEINVKLTRIALNRINFMVPPGHFNDGEEVQGKVEPNNACRLLLDAEA